MDHAPLRAGAFVAGGLFIGIWLFLGLFQTPTSMELHINVGYWWFWGLIGLLIAGGIFASRVTSANARIVIWIALGIAVGMLIGAALFQRIGEAVAALFTAGGGAIIVTGLPDLQSPHPQPLAPQWPEPEEVAAPTPRRAAK